MNCVDFGKIVAHLRKERKMTQSELAAVLNVSDKAVSKWETGQGYPEITVLAALSDFFEVTVDFLLKGNSRGITIAGNLIVDIVNMVDKYPEKNMLANVLSSVKSVGGCAINTIINLAKLDSDIFLNAAGKVGNDENGKFIVSQMKKYGIDVSRVKMIPGIPTSNTAVMTDSGTSERTFFYTSGTNATFGIDDIDIESLNCEIFHIGYILLLDELDREDDEYGTKMARLLKMVRDKGIKTSIDVVSEESDRFSKKIIPALKYCSYAFMNEYECCKVSGLNPRNEDGSLNISAIKETMAMFFKYGLEEKAIVHASEAGFIMNANGDFIMVPSLDLPNGFIKGTVGAGDAYASGCLYGIYKGYSDKEILEFASCVSACSLTEADATSGMKPIDDVIKLGQQFKRKKI